MLSNSPTGYGAVARTLHWLTALVILTAIGLALYGEDLPRATGDEVAAVARIYSLHKTLGVTAFFLALARILWALTQSRPGALHPERRAETFLADLVHWALYGAMLVMPLSGWIYHSALTGFAPILWPLPQDLPFVPKSEAVAHAANGVHKLSALVLYGAIGLHVLGALKHAVLERDGTLARMVNGRGPVAPAGGHSATPALTAVGVWLAVLGIALGGPTPEPAAPADSTTAAVSQPAAVPGAVQEAVPDAAGSEAGAHPWTVTEGTLGLSLKQMGAEVAGSFTGWTASIDYDEASRTGSVEVQIPLTGLKLGSVTDQALGAEFFDATAHPTAVFTADIAPDAAGPNLVATGTLMLRGTAMPVVLPFTLTVEGDRATMQGQTMIDRRDWGIGPTYKDEATVGFPVTVSVALTATRG
ncbi:cytochrome b/b6 domain-containing protein [Frigidibacter sp. MR17.14]|uniref:cytochrome b/b6 domain-containing protein n=1 Tax=Frigidibacter sp. MR17.14 TaxID=3126509 RepID=UPI003012BB5F